jgi:ribosomal protein L37AE/L43A
LSLQKGDYIRFRCQLDNGIYCAPHLKADDFELADKEEWALPKVEKENVVFESPYCFKVTGNKREGPFCMKCHILDSKKLVPLSPWGRGQWKCQVCDTMFYGKDFKPVDMSRKARFQIER